MSALSKWKDLSIRNKLNTVTGALVLGMAIVTVLIFVTFARLATINSHGVEWNHHLRDVQSAGLLAKSIANDERGYLLTGDSEFTDEIDERKVALRKLIGGLADGAPDEASKVKAQQLNTAVEKWLSSIEQELTLYETDKQAAVTMSIEQTRPLRKEYEQLIAEDVDGLVKLIDEEMDLSSIIRTAEIEFVVIIVLVVGFVGGLNTVLARSIGTRTKALKRKVGMLEEGDLTVNFVPLNHDEIGTVTDSLRSFVDRLSSEMRTLGATAENVDNVASTIASDAVQLADTAAKIDSETQVLTDDSVNVGGHISSVVTSTDQMNAAIGEIAQTASLAAGTVSEAVTQASMTQQTINELGESSAKIGEVVSTITAIAEQTNLLALNATIEAARAGAAGAGFAVVAHEVKELAEETARATEIISGRVEAIQASTGEASTAIEQISQVIGRINDAQTTIASAVEEQAATTGEMTRSMEQASGVSTHMAKSIESVGATTVINRENVQHSATTANELEGLSKQLRAIIAGYKV